MSNADKPKETSRRPRPQWARRKAAGEAAYKVCRALLLFGFCFLIAQPLINKLSVSFMPEADLADPTVVNVPRQITLDNYAVVNRLMNYFPTLGKTALILISGAALQITVCTLAGYGFARYRFPLRGPLFACAMAIIIIPPQLIQSPLYLNFRFFDIAGLFRLINGAPLNLLNNVAAYLLLCAGGMGLKSGLYIFIMRQYFRGAPKEMEEAAYVDGCGRLRTFVQIMLPDALPMITSCFLFSFVWQYTDGFFSRLFLTRAGVISTRLGLLQNDLNAYVAARRGFIALSSQSYVGEYPSAIVATGLLVSIAPLILIYLFAQRTFVMSLSQTGIKM
ncbi:MAG: carbohydrate ABC transporter permease [Treponema sp.]|jgi:multiple sugar transport system permease protein|nr:carbohydrate ABC transporter permease [Treponema sp.]